jgi:hypothetical protein
VAGSVSGDGGVSDRAGSLPIGVVSLTDRFGEVRAMAEPAVCVAKVVRDVLAGWEP